MTILTDILIIPSDVQLVPVMELPESVRSQLEWVEGDVAITHLRSRAPSRVVNGDFAKLFSEFQAEKTIVEAVMHYSLVQAADPHETLESAFPLIKQFVSHGLLVSPGKANETSDRLLHRDERLDNYTIVRCIRTLEDSEIYQAKTADNRTVAIKIKRREANRLMDRVLQHEADILRLLNGRLAPRLITQGEWAERPYLVIEWCHGADLMRVSAERQGKRDQLLDLCIAVLDAYVQLHEAGILHGDIHPGNILVDEADQVKLIDFGLAQTANLSAPYRGGVPFYYEPEYVSAFLNEEPPPAATTKGEQYALATLLYQMLTGTNYLNFSLEENVLYNQILEEVAQPFSDHNIEPWPEVEVILQQALAKTPNGRFQTVAAFRDALHAVRMGLDEQTADIVQTAAESHVLVDEVLEQLVLNGDLLRAGLSRPPYASINFGAAGIAYTLYRMACIRHDPELLALSDVWLSRSELAVGDEAGFYNAELDMAVETIGRISPYHTPSGIYAARFLIAGAMGDLQSQMTALWDFTSVAGQPCVNIDITLGKAGVVLISAMLYEALPDKKWAEQSGLLTLGNALYDELWGTIDSYGPIGPDCELINLGIAHGWAGLLFATLRWHQATGAALPCNLGTRLNELASCAEEIGRGCQWLWEFNRGELSMSGWCNGSAGYIYLWSLAHRLLDNNAYRNLALRAGWHVWEDSAVVASLCCGLTGRSYSLLCLYQLTGDSNWLDRSRILAQNAAHHIRHSQSEEYDGFEMSLYKGELGVALLLTDLQNPEMAFLPFFAAELPPPTPQPQPHPPEDDAGQR
jgi:eukaryotic-like serine/threonine-protein kinase